MPTQTEGTRNIKLNIMALPRDGSVEFKEQATKAREKSFLPRNSSESERAGEFTYELDVMPVKKFRSEWTRIRRKPAGSLSSKWLEKLI